MKSKNALISIMVSLTTLILGTQPFFANELPELPSQEYTIQGDYIIDTQGNQYYNFVNASGESVSLEEALIIFNSSTIDDESYDIQTTVNTLFDNALTPFAVTPAYTLVDVATINSHYVGTEKKVSPDFLGPCTMQYTTSTSISHSVTGSLSVEGQLAIFNQLKLEFGVAIGYGETQTETYSIGDYIPSGQIAAVYFKPYYVRATGTYYGNGIPQTFTSYYPVLLANKCADGLFYISRRAA